MATKGTKEYEIWKAKYTIARANGKSTSTAETHNLAYFLNNLPKNCDSYIWRRAAEKATKDKEVSFAAVRAIYNVYMQRESASLKARVLDTLYATERASAEEILEQSLIK